jgi:hypothetical protein
MLRRSKRLALRQETIPNLPDDIIRQCLLRVPYKSHSNLKAVCRKWRDVVGKPEFYKDRMTTGTREHLICMIQCLRRRIRSTRYPAAALIFHSNLPNNSIGPCQVHLDSATSHARLPYWSSTVL